MPLVEWKKGIKLAAPPPTPKYFDGRLVRERFMELKSDEEILNFLNQLGRFSRLAEAERLRGWRQTDIAHWQTMFAEFAKRPPDKWSKYIEALYSSKPNFNILGVIGALNLSSRHAVEFHWHGLPQIDWRGAKHLAVIETSDVVSAILSTIEIDHLRGAKFGVCARRDCPQFFEITSRHSRKYCSQYCAHLESVRRTRKRQKQERRKSHGKTKAMPGRM